MKCNLTRMVRCIIVVIITVMCINVAVFLQSPHSQLFAGSADGFRSAGLLESAEKGRDLSTPPPLKLNSTTTCPGLQMREARKNGEFQEIKGLAMFVYSVFQDGRTVKIVALDDSTTQHSLPWCQMWFQGQGHDPLFITMATKESLPEDHGRRYTASFVYCSVPENLRNSALVAVSLVTGKECDIASNILFIPPPSQVTSEFTVCVTPLNYRYSRAYELVEMVEMNKLLGAQRIVFYNHSTGPNVDKVLRMYSHSGDVEVHPWNLPMKTDTWPPSGDPEIHYFGQIASLNDCLYRYRNRSKYLVFQDLDEFIIPYTHDSWADLIRDREKQHPGVAVFQFKCVFFRKEWPSPAKDFESAAMNYKSVILSHTLRESEYLPYGIRSKYIVDPKWTSLVGIHQAWATSKNLDTVPENDAGLHHYRTWERPTDPQRRVVDERAVSKYGHRLVQKLQEAWSKLHGVEMNINISTYGDHV